MEKFLLLDANSLIFRSYFAFIKNPLRNSKGQNTSGIFGFLNTIKKIKTKLASENIALAFDAPGETLRDKVFKEYKATRPTPPKDMLFQIEKSKEIAHFLGIKSFEVSGYEADDILATLAMKLKDYGEVYIVSPDKDLLQLVSEKIFVYDPFNDILYNPLSVIEKFGVSAQKIGDYLALSGDTIDNIPGVPGIGPQRALEILKKHDTLKEAMEKEPRLLQHREVLLLSRHLIELCSEVPISIEPQELRPQKYDMERLIPALNELDFHSFIKEFAPRYDTELKIKNILPVGSNLGNSIGIFFEGDKIYIANNEKDIYILNPDDANNILNDPHITKIGFDIKEGIKKLKIQGPLFDIKIAAWLIDPNIKIDKFEIIALKYINCYVDPKPEYIPGLSLKLYLLLEKRLKELGVLELYKNIEEPLLFVLAQMENRGIAIDIPFLKELKRRIEKEMSVVTEECYKITGKAFNINSPKQLAQILFEELKLPPVKKGKSHYSTDFEVLQQLSLRHDLPKNILKFRELAKTTSTYIEPLIDFAKNDRIHTTFNQTGTATGRLSSSNPNIQNIPIRGPWGSELRKAFRAQDGYLLISADYSQIELRLLAHLTKDRNLIEAFKSKKDIHNHTASLIFNVPEDRIDDEKRRIAKVVNYGLIYGMGDYGLAQELGISREEANQFIQSYYTLYSGVEEWRQNTILNVEQRGYAETLFGRKRPIPEINSENYNLKETAKRLAINSPIQGTAADLIKLAMIEVEKKLTEANFKSGLLLSIHDELLFEIEEERIEEAKSIIKQVMENVYKFDVPIEVDINIGKNWQEAH